MMRPHHAIGVFKDLERDGDLRLQRARKSWLISASHWAPRDHWQLQSGTDWGGDGIVEFAAYCLLRDPHTTMPDGNYYPFPHAVAAYDYARMSAEMKAFRDELLRCVMNPSRLRRMGYFVTD
jgi:hypothetical protein